jgi:NTP pyrophosphatase (non-canonical NTP hydrolase)
MNNYTEQSSRTCPLLGDEKLDLCHMVLGMNTEIVELQAAIEKRDVVNISEEIADVFWYAANYMRIRKLCDFEEEMRRWREGEYDSSGNYLTEFSVDENVLKLYSFVAELQDLVKKYVAYNKTITYSKETDTISYIFSRCLSICHYYNIDVDKALENNINKLKVRFPDKFNDESAINRDLEAERKELEK